MSEATGILWFVLDRASIDRLKKAVAPRYENEFYHHVTLQYGVTRQTVVPFIDKPWAIKMYAVAHNTQTQAGRVDTRGLPDTYGLPHITLSTAEGVKPFASVAMLQGEHQEAAVEPIELTGTIEFVLLRNITD